MKIKLIDKGTALPNIWKTCGASYGDWEELQNGKEIEVKTVPDAISGLVKAVALVLKNRK